MAIGEARPLVRDALSEVVKVHEADTLAAAVRSAFALAPPGGTVLLAPACASFDMFRTRGARTGLQARSGEVEEGDANDS